MSWKEDLIIPVNNQHDVLSIDLMMHRVFRRSRTLPAQWNSKPPRVTARKGRSDCCLTRMEGGWERDGIEVTLSPHLKCLHSGLEERLHYRIESASR